MQGQRTQSSFSGKDLHKEVDVPARHAALHDVALFVWMVLDEAQCNTAKPRQIIGKRAVADPAFIFATRHVERPMRRAFNSPMTPDGARALLAVAPRAADEAAHVGFIDTVMLLKANRGADRFIVSQKNNVERPRAPNRRFGRGGRIFGKTSTLLNIAFLRINHALPPSRCPPVFLPCLAAFPRRRNRRSYRSADGGNKPPTCKWRDR